MHKCCSHRVERPPTPGIERRACAAQRWLVACLFRGLCYIAQFGSHAQHKAPRSCAALFVHATGVVQCSKCLRDTIYSSSILLGTSKHARVCLENVVLVWCVAVAVFTTTRTLWPSYSVAAVAHVYWGNTLRPQCGVKETFCTSRILPWSLGRSTASVPKGYGRLNARNVAKGVVVVGTSEALPRRAPSHHRVGTGIGGD